MEAKRKTKKSNRDDLSLTERLKIGMWALVLIVASMGNMLFYNQIMLAHESDMVLPWLIVVFMQFLSLIEIYIIAGGKRWKKKAST